NHAVLRNRFVECHPDTGVPVVGMQVPFWHEVLDMSRRISQEVGLGYIGVDIVVDAAEGPMLLEANARPGLAIQIANARGLLPRLQEIDALASEPQDTDTGGPEQEEDERIIIGKIGPRRKSA